MVVVVDEFEGRMESNVEVSGIDDDIDFVFFIIWSDKIIFSDFFNVVVYRFNVRFGESFEIVIVGRDMMIIGCL